MAMAHGISSFLQEHRIPFEVFWHKYADTSLRAAHEAGLSARQVVKAVILVCEGKPLMVLVPASKMIDMAAMEDYVGGPTSLADPAQFEPLFADCEPGCIPVTGPAYGFITFLDEDLARAEDLYFSAGDKEEMIHVKGRLFRQAIGPVYIGEFSRPAMQ